MEKLREQYENEVKQAMMKKFGYTSHSISNDFFLKALKVYSTSRGWNTDIFDNYLEQSQKFFEFNILNKK